VKLSAMTAAAFRQHLSTTGQLFHKLKRRMMAVTAAGKNPVAIAECRLDIGCSISIVKSPIAKE